MLKNSDQNPITWTISASLSLFVASESKTMFGSSTTPWTKIFSCVSWVGDAAASTWLGASVEVTSPLSVLCICASLPSLGVSGSLTPEASREVWLTTETCGSRGWFTSDGGMVMNSSKRSKKGKLTKMVAFCKDTWTEKDENKKRKEKKYMRKWNNQYERKNKIAMFSQSQILSWNFQK